MTKRVGGRPEPTVITHDTLISWSLLVGGIAVQISANMLPCFWVSVQNDLDNPAGTHIRIGTAGDQSYVLDVGSALAVNINDASKVWVIANQPNTRVNCAALA